MIKRYKKNEIENLVKILKNDGVISVPTDTVFGICARINSETAHDKLIAVKNRPIKKVISCNVCKRRTDKKHSYCKRCSQKIN